MGDAKKDSKAGRAFLRNDWGAIDFEKTDQALNEPAPALEKPIPADAAILDLIPKEAWDLGTRSIAAAILGRKSRRKFEMTEVSLAEISFLLYATQGVRKSSQKYTLRSAPSGGARQPFETYLFAERLAGVPRGLYRYMPLEHKLLLEQPHRDGMEGELDAATLGQFWNAAAYFIWTALPYRTEWRYAGGSHKIIAIDAGHLCQNLYLACEAVGCGTCGIGAYDQGLMDRFLKVDGVDEFAIYMAPVGKVAD